MQRSLLQPSYEGSPMGDFTDWLNKNSPLISAIATAVAAIKSVVIVGRNEAVRI
jgi:hypothetical protein